MKIFQYLDDALMIVGAALIVNGVSQLSIPVAWMVAGLFCIIGALLIGTANNKESVNANQ